MIANPLDYWNLGEPLGLAAKSPTTGVDYYSSGEPFGGVIIVSAPAADPVFPNMTNSCMGMP